MLLSLAGHETHVARTRPGGARRAPTRCDPTSILLDLGLPGLNGYEVCRRLRAAAWARAIPIIAITGWGQAEDRQRSKDAGFDGHLVKPVVLGDLNGLARRVAALDWTDPFARISHRLHAHRRHRSARAPCRPWSTPKPAATSSPPSS